MWLDEIEKREKLASEAPWVIHSDCLAHPVQVAENEWEAEQLSEYIEGEGNRDFIANSRDDIPRMVRVLRELAEYGKALEGYAHNTAITYEREKPYLSDDAKELLK